MTRLRILTLLWRLSHRMTCWLSRRRVVAMDRARSRGFTVDVYLPHNAITDDAGRVVAIPAERWRIEDRYVEAAAEAADREWFRGRK